MAAEIVEAAPAVLTADLFVDLMTTAERDRAGYIRAHTGELSSLATYTTPDGERAIPWYRRQINKQARGVGGRCVHHVIPGDDLEVVRQLGLSREHADMPFLPLEDSTMTGRVISAVDPLKDIDNLTGRSPWYSATARGAVARLNGAIWGSGWYAGKTADEAGTVHLGRGYEDSPIVVVGDGVVGMAIAGLLRSQGAKIPDEHIVGRDKNQRALQGLGKGAILLTASPQAAQITNEILPEDGILIDVGCGRFEGERCGNAHPALLERPDVTVTPPKGKGSTGHATASYLWLHTLEASRLALMPAVALAPLGSVALGPKQEQAA